MNVCIRYDPQVKCLAHMQQKYQFCGCVIHLTGNRKSQTLMMISIQWVPSKIEVSAKREKLKVIAMIIALESKQE